MLWYGTVRAVNGSTLGSKRGAFMKQGLSSQKCESCAGLPPLSAGEVAEFMKDSEVEGWVLEENRRIVRTFLFEGEGAKEWNKMYGLSEHFVKGLLDRMIDEDHHAVYTHSPTRRGANVRVELTTHAVKGLSKNDFRMAAKLNRLYEEWKEE